MINIEANTIGEALIKSMRLLLSTGKFQKDEDTLLLELELVFLEILNPCSSDPVVYQIGDAKSIDWMLKNFFVYDSIPELNDTISYKRRLFDFGDLGFNQIEAVIKKLKIKSESKSATLSTLMPGQDATYVPCVCIIDYWIRGGRLNAVIYARSLDFGKKAYANFIALTKLSEIVAQALDIEVGSLSIFVKSAHIYERDIDNSRHQLEKVTACTPFKSE